MFLKWLIFSAPIGVAIPSRLRKTVADKIANAEA
jgi:hypothetical protein